MDRSLVAITPVWGRKTVAMEVVARLTKQGVPVVVAGSEGRWSRNLADLAGCAAYIEVANVPLSGKFNGALQCARQLGAEAVVVVGSDNMLTDGLIALWRKWLAEGVDYMGIIDGLVYMRQLDKCIYWPGYSGRREGEPIGSGRCFSSKLLDDLAWHLWPRGVNRGLDYASTQRLDAYSYEPRVVVGRYHDDIAHLGIRTGESQLSSLPSGVPEFPAEVDRLFGEGIRD